MSEKRTYDTRFFVEYFYSDDADFRRKLKEDLRRATNRVVSALTVHEIYRINSEKEEREVANLRAETIHRDLDIADVDYETAIRSAELRSKYKIPMADSVIAATAQIHGCPLVSDDPHFQIIEGLKTRWYPKHQI